MAEQLEEEIIIIDEAEAAGVAQESTEESGEPSGSSNKKLFALLGGGVLLLVLAAVAVVSFIATSKSEAPKQIDFEQIDSKIDEGTKSVIEPSQLEKMIAKANMLYESGNKDEALGLYERIALYSEAISQYNLGVAQLKEGQYATALSTFKKAIGKGENRCVSAINAAVCALHLNNRSQFDYYIELAYASLPYELDSPLYSYYYALVHYYRGHYAEALTALRHPTADEYFEAQKHLRSRIDSLFGNYHDALTALEAIDQQSDALSLGLLYANIGDLTLAKQYLSEAILNSPSALEPQLALSYVYLKSGQLLEGGKLLTDTTDLFGERVYEPYPVRVFLKDALFEPEAAQNFYRNQLRKARSTAYQKIFYFAPYKVFNASQTISYIRKGTANIYIDDISSAKEYLEKSRRSSAVNRGIAKAIQKSLTFRLREANQEFQALHKLQPKHSILNYNLALTYAQMGDMPNAYDYFLRSYHLDANNYLSGIFAVMSAKLINVENPKLLAIIKENLAQEDDSEEIELYRTLLDISDDNYLGALTWLDTDFKERPLYLILKLLIAEKTGRTEEAQRASDRLVYLLPRDLMPHLLHIDTYFEPLADKAYAAKVLNYLKAQDFHFEDLYFGAYITRYLYVQNALITGRLFPLREQLKRKLSTTNESPQDIMGALALASIYDRQFEEAYLLYNQLIDDYAIRDSRTLFLGAVASTGARHHANAIALLELAKLKDPNNMESRYALGLLYLEAKNNQGAGIQFRRIGNSGFSSEFFNFGIDTGELLFKRRQAENNATEQSGE